MSIQDVIPTNLRALEERVKRQQERVMELQRTGHDARNAIIVLDVMTEALLRIMELHAKSAASVSKLEDAH
jgi:hypothetical protein